MPVCSIHLLAFTPQTSFSAFLSTLRTSSISPLVISRVIRWVILPSSTSTDPLLARNIHWDLLLILPSTSSLPASLQQLIHDQWTVTAGIPSRLLADFAVKNQKLLHPWKADIPELTGSLEKPCVADSSQGLELSPELNDWIRTFSTQEGSGAVSMLNLLSFRPNMKSSYLKYGKAFAESIGSKRGGNAKLVGTVVDVNGKRKEEGGENWDEIALAHYPSIAHFADMLASEDYQSVNQKYRVPSLRDTFILCTSELGLEYVASAEAKL